VRCGGGMGVFVGGAGEMAGAGNFPEERAPGL
jgi:hypothetical protein